MWHSVESGISQHSHQESAERKQCSDKLTLVTEILGALMVSVMLVKVHAHYMTHDRIRLVCH